MEQVLVKWSDNWADEMNIEGFNIFTKTEWNEFKTKLKNAKKEFTIGVGSNEDINYKDGRKLLSNLSAKEITEDESKIIKKFLGNNWGHTQFMNVLDNIEEDEEE